MVLLGGLLEASWRAVRFGAKPFFASVSSTLS